MTRYRIERTVVSLLGFLAGAALAMCVVPGDMLLWVAAGITLALFSHAFFIRDFGGELLWPLADLTAAHDGHGNRPNPGHA